MGWLMKNGMRVVLRMRRKGGQAEYQKSENQKVENMKVENMKTKKGECFDGLANEERDGFEDEEKS